MFVFTKPHEIWNQFLAVSGIRFSHGHKADNFYMALPVMALLGIFCIVKNNVIFSPCFDLYNTYWLHRNAQVVMKFI